MEPAVEIISKIDHFPFKLKKTEGELLKESFVLDKRIFNEQEEVRDIKYRYTKNIDGLDYVLIEEFMFKDNETEFDIFRAIGVNFYINKVWYLQKNKNMI